VHRIRTRLLDGKGLSLLGVALFTLLAPAMITPALPVIQAHFRDVPNSALLTKLILTMPPLFVALAGPWLGVATGRLGAKRMLTWSVLGIGVFGSLGAALSTLPELLACRAILGVTIAGMMVSSTTLIGDLYRGQDRMTFLGLQAATMKLGAVIFTALGGVLAAIGWRAAFAGHLLMLLVLPGVLLALQEPARETTPAERTQPTGIDASFTALVCVVAFFGMVIYFAIPTQVPFLMTERLHSKPQEIGLLISASTLFGILTAATYQWFKARLQYVTISALALAATAAAFAALAGAATVSAMYAALATVGLAYGLLIPNMSAWMLAGTKPEQHGRAIGTLTMALFLGQFFSPLIAQPFVSTSGIGNALGIAAGSCALVAILLAVLSVARARVALEPVG
jgi:MFS family permease